MAERYGSTMAKAARNPVSHGSSVDTVLWNVAKTTRPTASRTILSQTHNGRPTLLWIDDFEPMLEVYRAMFEALGFRVLTASSGEDGLALAALNQVDVVVTDYEMPRMDGEALALALKELKPEVPVVLCSGSTLNSPRILQTVDACCDKAGSRERLLATIHTLLQRKRRPALQPPPVGRASDHGQRTVA